MQTPTEKHFEWAPWPPALASLPAGTVIRNPKETFGENWRPVLRLVARIAVERDAAYTYSAVMENRSHKLGDLLIALFEQMESGQCVVSLSTLAAQKSRNESTIQRQLQYVLDAGLMQIKTRGGNGKGSFTRVKHLVWTPELALALGFASPPNSTEETASGELSKHTEFG